MLAIAILIREPLRQAQDRQYSLLHIKKSAFA